VERQSRPARGWTGISLRIARTDLDVLILVEIGFDQRPAPAAKPKPQPGAGAEAGSTRRHGVVAHV
jgi:hypothetical protein